MAEAPEAADPAEIEEHGIVALLENVPDSKKKKSSYAVKMGLAQMLRGGVIMDVDNVEQARIAEESGAAAVMVLGQKKTGHVERMSDPDLVKEIKKAVSIPVMAKVRIGHFVEAQILEALDVDFVDESEVLSIADDENFINKHNFRMPFVCGYCDLGEALRRIAEGAAMMRTKGGSDGGNIMEAVKQARSLIGEVRHLQAIHEDELFAFSKSICAPYELVKLTKQLGRIPVVNFAAGGITTPADAAMLMQVGCDGIFIGSEIFRLPDPSEKVRSIVRAVLNYNDSQILAEVSGGINEINLDGRNAE